MYFTTSKSILSTSLLLGIAANLTACVSNPAIQAEDAVTLDPLALTTLKTGDVRKFVDEVSGTSRSWTVSSVDGGMVTQEDQNGCSWTTSGDPIEPSSSWKNCGTDKWSTGGTKNQKIKGGLWPLAVGNKASYTQRFYNSTDTEGSGSGTKKCKVKSIESIDISGTSLDAFKVVCTQGYGDKKTRNYWFAPDAGLLRYNTGSNEKLVRTL